MDKKITPLTRAFLADPKYPTDISLWPLQEQLRDAALTELALQNWSLLKIGQRGSKNVLAGEIARRGLFNRAFVFDSSPETMCKNFPIPTYWCSKTFPRSLVEGNESKPIIIINEAFWMHDSYDIFNEAREYAPTLVVGSNGPQFVGDQRWQALKGHSYATWEINPNFPDRNSLMQVMTSLDHFERDFGAF